jgi:hypothetical protein
MTLESRIVLVVLALVGALVAALPAGVLSFLILFTPLPSTTLGGIVTAVVLSLPWLSMWMAAGWVLRKSFRDAADLSLPHFAITTLVGLMTSVAVISDSVLGPTDNLSSIALPLLAVGMGFLESMKSGTDTAMWPVLGIVAGAFAGSYWRRPTSSPAISPS